MRLLLIPQGSLIWGISWGPFGETLWESEAICWVSPLDPPARSPVILSMNIVGWWLGGRRHPSEDHWRDPPLNPSSDSPLDHLTKDASEDPQGENHPTVLPHQNSRSPLSPNALPLFHILFRFTRFHNRLSRELVLIPKGF
jgi:hypothetical protein